MFGIPTDLIASYGVVGAIALVAVLQFIKSWADTNKERVKANAEANLYQNLSAENNRMSEMLVNLNVRMDILIKDNTALLSRVASLEASVKELSVWESKAILLQTEVVAKDKIIAKLNLKIAEQALMIEKLCNRGKE